MRRFAVRFCPLAIFANFIFAAHGDSASAAEVRSFTREQTLIIGAVSSDPKSRMPRLEAMAGYLAEQAKDLGFRQSGGVVAGNNEEMVQLLRDGSVDIVSETVFSSLYFAEAAGAEFLLREWKKGIPEYRTVFIARRDKGIRTLNDLHGKKIAFEDSGSTSGFLLPLALMKEHGLEVVKAPPLAKARPDRVSYAFASTEVNIAAWVARGTADAGAFSTQDWEDIARTPKPLKLDLVVFQKSPPIMRSVLLVRSGLNREAKDRIKQVLQRMHKDSVGKKVLRRYGKIARYDEISGPALKGFNIARRLYPLVAEEVR